MKYYHVRVCFNQNLVKAFINSFSHFVMAYSIVAPSDVLPLESCIPKHRFSYHVVKVIYHSCFFWLATLFLFVIKPDIIEIVDA